MKKFEDHIKSFVFNVGKYKDEKLVDVTDLNWLDWFVKSEYSSKWQKKLVNWYINDAAKSIIDSIEKQKELAEDNKIQEELKNGKWVDQNF